MKQKLFLDFDGVIADSVKAYCRLYTFKYNKHLNFKSPDYTKVNLWDLSDECYLAKDNVEEMFSDRSFFKFLDFMPNAREIMLKLNDKYDTYICSIGTLQNIKHKSVWLHRFLPEIKNIILIANEGCKMDKSIIDMSNGILIDDNLDNLLTSNANRKYTYGEIKSWNEKSCYSRLLDWRKVDYELL